MKILGIGFFSGCLACSFFLPVYGEDVEGEEFSPDQSYESRIAVSDIYLNQQQDYEDVLSVGFKPRADVQPWPFEVPVNWSADPFDDANWKFQLHAWRGVDPVIKKYLDSGEVKYFNEAMSFVRDWYEFHEENGPSEYTWYDMSVGIRAMRISFLLDEVYEGKVVESVNDVDILYDLAERHVRYLTEEENINKGNHGFFQVFGLRMLCTVIEGEVCEGERQYSEEMLEEILERAYTEEGVHKEHSPSYHAFTLRVLRNFNVDAVMGQGVLDVIQKAEEITPWLAWPTGRFVEAGDSAGTTDTLVAAPEITCLERHKCFAVGDFTDSGYAVIRSDPGADNQNSMLFFTGMSYSRVHKHVDELSFSLFENGEMLFIDSGKYGYGDDDWRDYVVSASAHNTISLADEDVGLEYIGYNGSYLSEVLVSEEGFHMVGEVERRGLFFQSREITYLPGENLVVRDVLSSEGKRIYVSSLHLAAGLEPVIREDGFDVVLSDGSLVQAHLEEKDCLVESVRGQLDPIIGWVSVGYKKMEPASVVRAVCSGDNRSITWNVQL